MPTILTKKSDTPGAIPATANLTNAAGGAELAVNTADKRLFTINSSSAVVELGTNPSSLTCADASFTVARIGSLTISSLSLSNATFGSATITNLTSTSATITNLLATSLTVSSGSTLNGGVVINEPGADVDFRVEGDTDANLIFADASADFVGIGTSTPATKLDVSGRAQFVNNGFNYVLVDSTASDSYFRLASAGTVKWYLRNNTANTNALEITPDAGSTTGLFLTQSGNLGLGVTPSAWSAFKAFEVASAGNSLWSAGSNDIRIATNFVYNLGNKYVVNGLAAQYIQTVGQHQWYTAPSGTAGNAITFTQAMTLDASGRLGVGTTSPVSLIHGKGTSNADVTYRFEPITNSYKSTLYVSSASSGDGGIRYDSSANQLGLISYSDLLFYVGTANISGSVGNERARITSGGELLVNRTATSSGAVLAVTGTNNNLAFACWNSGNSEPNGIEVYYSAAAPNGTANRFFNCVDTGATRASIRSNGGLANYQANNVDLSDARTKNSITPAASMWGKVAALEIVTYKYNDQTHDDVNLGVIAQQVEAVEPVWVDSDGWGDEKEGEEPLKTVYTKDITFAAIKALQEAMARIEQLEAKVAALEAK